MNIISTASMELNKKQMDYTFSPNFYNIPCSHSFNTSCEYCSSSSQLNMLGGEDTNEFYHYIYNDHHHYINNDYVIDKMDDQPFKYNYLLNLFSAPNMSAFLAEATITDDLYALPIHLQRLISEAKEEVVIERTKLNQGEQLSTANHPALQRLERFRSYCWLRSDADTANLMSLLMEVANDDDELQHIIMD
ncbi:unnamed protein product [Cunninghamella blakesleeana]